MASQAPASSPSQAPPSNSSNANVRRSFTLPARIANKPRTVTSQSSSDGIETLFVCAATKIVSFTTSTAARRTSPPRRRSPNRDDATPTIPWRSSTDRTLAVGPLRIYRVTSSNVSFLNSGNLLHTIFPRSQCWCVDGQSVFVLRIRQDAYYRIELPHETAEDNEKVEDFKQVLGQVLQYERTRCPFTRGFEVDLPERPKTPPRKHRPRKPTEKAKKWTFDKTWMPENGSRPCTPVLEGSDAGTASSYEEDDASSICTDRSEPLLDTPAPQADATPPRPAPKPALAPRLSVSERAKMFQGGRSVTAPLAQQRHRLSVSSVSSEAIPEEATHNQESRPHLERQESTVSTNDSFYSLETPSDGSPSPPFLDAEVEPVNPWAAGFSLAEEDLRGRTTHKRQTSELTVRPSSSHATDSAPLTPTDAAAVSAPAIHLHLSPAPSTPPLVSDSDEDTLSLPSLDAPTPPNAIRLHRLTGASQKRAFSPMPHPQNLFCPPATGPRQQFTAALIRKTAEIVLGPPAHLVSLMLRIAAKISDGVSSFNTYRVRSIAEKVPGGWLSDDDEDEWEEDDFGIPLRALDDSTERRQRAGVAPDVD